MMLVLDAPIAAARNDAAESPGPRSIERALQRMGFAMPTVRGRPCVEVRPDADWTPLRDTSRRDGRSSRTRCGEPAPEWRPL